jgi:hypothetical protein
MAGSDEGWIGSQVAKSITKAGRRSAPCRHVCARGTCHQYASAQQRLSPVGAESAAVGGRKQKSHTVRLAKVTLQVRRQA